MKSETRLELKTFWNNHLRQWKETSLSQAQYCKKNGLLVQRFGYWKRKLMTNTNTLPTQSNSFVQLPVVCIPPLPDISTPLTVQLPNQLRVEGITHNNLELTKKLVEQLQ